MTSVLSESVVCEGWNVCLIWLLGDSATQPLLEMCDLPRLICVSEALPASSACFRNELFQAWQCRNHSHAQLCQYRLEFQHASSQIFTSPHALKLCPANLFQRMLVPLGHLWALVQEITHFLSGSGSLAAKWLSKRWKYSWKQPLLALCLLHKAILNQCAFVFYSCIAVLCMWAALYSQDFEVQHKS